MKPPRVILACLPSLTLAVIAACGAHAQTEHKNPSPMAQPATAGAGMEAGALLTKEEVGAVQGCAILDAKTSAGQNGQFRLSQCFFSAAEPNKSVSFAVAQADPDARPKRTIDEFWHETFDRYSKEGDEEEKEHDTVKKGAKAGEQPGKGKEKEEAESPPRRIEGLGDGAYWASNPVGGVLYALKGQRFIRISVGGPDDQEAKLGKSKALAEKALARM